LNFVAFLSRKNVSYPSLRKKVKRRNCSKANVAVAHKHLLWFVQSFRWVIAAPSCSNHTLIPPKSDHSVRLNKSQKLPCENVWDHLRTDGFLGLRRAFKRTCVGASYVAICSSGILEGFWPRILEECVLINVLVESSSFWEHPGARRRWLT